MRSLAGQEEHEGVVKVLRGQEEVNSDKTDTSAKHRSRALLRIDMRGQ